MKKLNMTFTPMFSSLKTAYGEIFRNYTKNILFYLSTTLHLLFVSDVSLDSDAFLGYNKNMHKLTDIQAHDLKFATHVPRSTPY